MERRDLHYKNNKKNLIRILIWKRRKEQEQRQLWSENELFATLPQLVGLLWGVQFFEAGHWEEVF